MTASELYRILDQKIPRSLSCEWDNDGLMCCPNGDREIKKVLIALDVTGEIVERACAGGYDLIVSHHPFIFKGIKSIDSESFICDKAIKLIKNDVCVFSFHTRLDALTGGVNDALAKLCGVGNTQPFGEDGMGRIGTLACDTDLDELARTVKNALDCEGVFVADGKKKCRKVALLGGGGSDYIDAAIEAGADTFISGELKYHNLVDAPDMGINIIEAGHFHTEYPVCKVLKKMIEETDGGITCDIVNSNKIKLI